MLRRHDPHLRTDLLKLACLGGAAAGTIALFIITPALSTPTLLALMASIFLSPLVSTLERKGLSRPLSICLIFIVLGAVSGSIGFWAIQSGMAQWDLLKKQIPHQYNAALYSFHSFERQVETQYPFLSMAPLRETIVHWLHQTSQWFVDHGPALMGELLTWTFVVPPLTFLLLNEGRSIRRGFFQLVPNRFFESFFLITTDTTAAISDYLRAKLLEGLLVAFLVTGGLALINAPYALILGAISGATNLLPYVGPILGAIPGILIVAFDPSQSTLIVPVTLVYLVAHLVDSLLIFPLIVAKLIHLHPLILIAVVAVGQKYYGLIGMIISIPVAAAVKIILQEIYTAVYKQKLERPGSTLNLSITSEP